MAVTIDGTKGVATPSGSAGTPSHADGSFVNGLYFPTSTSAALATNGAVAVTISSSQYVGIASSSPTAPLTVGNITNSWSVGNISAMIASTAINAGGLTIGGSIGTASAAGSTTYIFTDTTTGVGGIQVKNFAGTQYDLALQQQGGNVGIGTTSPNGKLDVNAGARTVLAISANSQYWQLDNRGTFDSTSNALVIGYNGAVEVARFTPSGNLGLGVTPSAWSSGKAFEVGQLGNAFWGASTSQIAVTSNVYFNAGWKFGGSGYASQYQQQNGYHYWYSSTASGVAGGTVTWTNSNTAAMTLDASGNLGIGATATAIGSYRVLQVNGASGGYISLGTGGTEYANLYGDTGTGLTISAAGARNILFQTNAAERMRIDSSGNVGIGTTGPAFASGSGVHVERAGVATYRAYNSSSAYAVEFRGGSAGAEIDARGNTPTTKFLIGGGEVARFDTSGNLLVNVTSVGVGKTTIYSTTNSQAAIDGRITASGDVGTRALYLSKFDNNSTTSQIFVQFAMNNAATGQGQINANGANAAAFGTYSDARLKENIVNLPSQLDNILALKPREFDYIESEGGGHQIGFIAQEMQQIYPDAVGERSDGMLTITAWSKTEARLVKAIQELAAKVQALEAKVA